MNNIAEGASCMTSRRKHEMLSLKLSNFWPMADLFFAMRSPRSYPSASGGGGVLQLVMNTIDNEGRMIQVSS